MKTPLKPVALAGSGKSPALRRLKYAGLMLPLLAGMVMASYGLWVKYDRGRHTVDRTPLVQTKLPQDVDRLIAERSLQELQNRIANKGQSFRWYMNIPKDQLPVIGPPSATEWHTTEQLWSKGVVGLYIPEKTGAERPGNMTGEDPKSERHKQILLEGTSKDL